MISVDEDCWISLGALGETFFPAGVYAYAGSALNSLDGRLRRHFSSKRKKHWHIDYLLEKGGAVDAYALPSTTRMECMLNALVDSLDGSREFAPGFGCSDCGCRTHLHRLELSAIDQLHDFLCAFEWDDAKGQKAR